MRKSLFAALALAGAALPAAVMAQAVTTVAQPIAGTRLDVSATGEVSRVPDIAIISAGVVTTLDRSATAAIERQCGADGAGPRGIEARRDRRQGHPDAS